MIFIFSKSEHEPSTEHVIDWLLFKNIEFKRINGSELLSVDTSSLYGTLDKNDIVWFRRWYNGGEVLKILSYGNINKDKIHVCKDCEFRYICTDCRAYVENPEDILSKPLKCGYNPYIGEWAEWSTNPLKQKAIDFYGMRKIID